MCSPLLGDKQSSFNHGDSALIYCHRGMHIQDGSNVRISEEAPQRLALKNCTSFGVLWLV